MNALDLLMQQHRKVDDLFEKLEETEESSRKKALFGQLADVLAIHTAIEERFFYPEASGARTEELMRKAVEEHLSMMRIVSDLFATDIDDPAFDARLAVLKEQVDLHVEQEEDELFPRVAKMLGEARLQALGQHMKNLAAELEAAAPRRDLPSQTNTTASAAKPRARGRPRAGGT